MNISETAKILAKAQLIDNRQVDPQTIKAWHEIVGHLDYRDAMTALNTHRAESTDYLTPAHIIAQARKARRARNLEESRQRAIAVSAERAELGPAATPIQVAQLRQSLKTALRSVS